MADQSDVEAALVGVIGGALYPNGLNLGCVVPGAVCRIYRGWPMPAALDADLAGGSTNISVAATSGHTLNTTRWPDSWITPAPITPTLTATVAGTTVTLGGSVGVGEVVAVIADSAWASVRPQATDTPGSIAADLARLLATVRSATATGATLTVPGTLRLVVRVEADQPTLRLARRQTQAFAATVWSADPAMRDAVGSAVDSTLAGIDFVGLADGTSGRVRYLASNVSDRWEDATLYRRELLYSVDYPTSIAQNLPRMAVGGTRVTDTEADVIGTLLS